MTKRPTNQSQPSAHEPRKFTAIHFSPRELRVLKHLLASRSAMREVVDHVAGSSNGPDVVARVRRKLNIEIPCDRVPATDRDGKPCKPGRYSLSQDDRIIVAAALQGVA